MQHRYFDVSNLNAPYDQIALGAGSIAAGGLGSLGATTSFPWKAYSTDTKNVQSLVNKVLKLEGRCPIDEDGKLGPATCGAIQYAAGATTGGFEKPPTCESSTLPGLPPCGGGGGVAPAPPAMTEPSVSSGSMGGDAMWIIGGLAVAGVALGAAFFWKKR